MLCVKNGNVHDAIHEEAYRADILVEDGRIKAIGEHLETEEGVQIYSKLLDTYAIRHSCSFLTALPVPRA